MCVIYIHIEIKEDFDIVNILLEFGHKRGTHLLEHK